MNMLELVLVLLLCGLCWGKRSVVITGANRGIGYEATRQLAATGDWQIIMAVRNPTLASRAISNMQGKEHCEIKELDLASLADVNRFCEEMKKEKRTIDVLACNAGIQVSGSANKGPSFTKDGYEITVGTNHIGHFAMIQALISSLESSSPSPRVVIVGSGVHNPDEPGGDVGSKATLGDMQGFAKGFKSPISMVDGSSYDADKAYKDSKLCNVITSLELARRLQANKYKSTCNVMNPGLIPTTGLFRDLNPIFVAIFTFITRYLARVAVSEEEGGKRLAYMIANPSLDGITGAYYSGKPGVDEFKPIDMSTEAKDQEKAKKFWDFSQQLVAMKNI